MPLTVKICGLTRKSDIDAAIEAGADYLGFIFYPPSKRALTVAAWAELAAHVAGRVPKVGVFVDATDDWLKEVNDAARLDFIQLHGKETPARVAEVSQRFAPVIKALSVSTASDLDQAEAYSEVANMLLFDAKPPKVAGAIPGGNGISFDWQLLADRQFALPWLLAGGIGAANLPAAIELTGARMVDGSSAIEDAPGIKNTAQLQEFLGLAKTYGMA